MLIEVPSSISSSITILNPNASCTSSGRQPAATISNPKASTRGRREPPVPGAIISRNDHSQHAKPASTIQ